MSVWTAVVRGLSRLAAVFTSRRHDIDLDDELESHLAMLVDEYRRQGMTDVEAARAARLSLGGTPQLRERHREVRGLPFIEEVARDLRYAVRGCRRQPGFTATAIVTLAIGIGANAAVFSLVHGVLMQPLPYDNPDALMSLTRGGQTVPGQPPNARWISLRRWEAMRESRTFEAAAYQRRSEDVILGGSKPEVVRGARISANLLSVLGVRPIHGRAFLPEEDAGGPAVALVSERLWTRRLDRSPSAVGETITLSSVTYTVIGVLPETFQFPVRDVEVWMPQPAFMASLAAQFHGCCTPLFGVARLKPGVTRQQAEAELSVLNAAYQPKGQRRVDSGDAILTPLKEDLVGPVDRMLWVLLGAVGLVLLIACANVATLLMARATSRAREFAIRSALGAGRWRVTRQLIAESLLLSLAGGALGLAVAYPGVRVVATMTLVEIPRSHEIGVNLPVLLWTTAIALITGLLFGTVPSLQLLRPNLVDRLRHAGSADAIARRANRFVRVAPRSALVVLQVALSLVLLIGAALMIQTMARLARVDLGFPTTGLVTMRVPLPVTTYDTPDKRARFFDELVTRVDGVSGVRGATVVRALPTTGGLGTNMQIDSQRIPEPGHMGLLLQTVVPGYFEVLGLPVKQGRTFEPRDNALDAPPVAIVNERFARKFWPSYPNATPVGDGLGIPILKAGRLEIVGVVADVRHAGLTREADPQVYIPDRLYPAQVAFLALRADGDPLRVVDAVRAQVRAIDVDQSVTDVMTMNDLLERSQGSRHLATRVLMLFALAAVVLALVGLYGVMGYSVAQRTQEIGVRRAFGAGQRSVVWMVLRQGLRATLAGIAFGVAGAYASTRLLESLLFDVTTTDLLTFGLVPVAFVLVSLVASLIPALRAARIEPASALRA